ncbi:MAG TPA: hypothetical protein VNP93_08140 [Gaiellaceae bacterium]|nr:hypothetical protein [Gaiellaceae bacterium]
MRVTLHRCGTPWKLGPCWRVQKALDDQGIRYEVVAGPWRPKNRAALLEGTGQPLYPAIQFQDGSWYRDESKEMARTISEGRLPENEQGRGRSTATLG